MKAAGPAATLWCWRHPRAEGAAGRCIGRIDLAVDRRRAKRLAHRIRQAARLHGLPRAVHVSPLERSSAVGRWLRRWGWLCRVEPQLIEVDFGAWDGLPWTQIAWSAVEAWQHDLLHHAPGGGESLAQLAARAQGFADAQRGPVLLVGHGGWINALRAVPPGCTALAAADWPAPPRHGALVVVPVAARAASPTG